MSETTPNITLNVEGMTCSSCAMSVTNTLKREGCEDVDVNFALGEAQFNMPQSADLQAIQSIEGLGFTTSLAGGKVTSKSGWSPIEKKFFATLPFTIPLFLHMFFPEDSFLQNPILQLVLCLPVYAIGLWHFGRSAFHSIRVMAPNMDVLIFTGSTAAFIYSLVGMLQHYGQQEMHNYLFFETAATIITLVLLGNLLEHRSVKQTTSAIEALGRLQPHHAKRVQRNGLQEEIVEIPLEEVQEGDYLMVNTGDRIPVDGRVKFGTGSVDQSMLTGESIPVTREKGSTVIGGTILLEGNISITAEAVGEKTVLAGIINMVKTAQKNKPAIQKLGDKVSMYFVPIVMSMAILSTLVGYFGGFFPLKIALMNGIAVLVISCPCAMGLATPTAVMAGLGRAARRGILIKGGSTLEQMARITTVVFDKTGTLTSGRFDIQKMYVEPGQDEQEIRSALLGLEQHSSHPIAQSLVRLLKADTTPLPFEKVEEKKGCGLTGHDNKGQIWQAGSQRLVPGDTASHSVYILKNDQLVGWVDLKDELKPEAVATIQQLQSQGIQTILLSGDKQANCDAVARQLGIQEVYAEKLPEEKLTLIDQLNASGTVAMVGDGINDAPALAKAEVGISLSNASEIAINSAQVVLLSHDALGKLPEALLLGKHSLLTIKQNLFWAFFYNVVAIPVAAIGLLNPMVGALSMAASDVVVIGNSIRLKSKKIS